MLTGKLAAIGMSFLNQPLKLLKLAFSVVDAHFPATADENVVEKLDVEFDTVPWHQLQVTVWLTVSDDLLAKLTLKAALISVLAVVDENELKLFELVPPCRV